MINDYSPSRDDIGIASNSPMVMGFVLGAVVGAGLALLMAPAPGQETRRKVGDVARRLSHEANDRLQGVRGTLNDLKRDAKAAVSKGREAFNRIGDELPSDDGRYSHETGSLRNV